MELPTDEPDVLPPSPPTDASNSGKETPEKTVSTGTITLQTAMQHQDKLFAMPQLQVCDVLTTNIVGIEVSRLYFCL